jgi:hypothetical protein
MLHAGPAQAMLPHISSFVNPSNPLSSLPNPFS